MGDSPRIIPKAQGVTAGELITCEEVTVKYRVDEKR